MQHLDIDKVVHLGREVEVCYCHHFLFVAMVDSKFLCPWLRSSMSVSFVMVGYFIRPLYAQ